MKALIWKEWRELRLFVLVAVGIIITTRGLFEMLPIGEIDRGDLLVGVGLFILPLLFSLFLGVIPFTNEFSRRTQSFLLSNPMSTAKIFWTKFLFSLVLLLCLLLLSRTICLTAPEFPPTLTQVKDFRDFLPFRYVVLPCILLYCAAFLSSLLVGVALTAVLCTPLILILGVLMLSPLVVVLSMVQLEHIFLFFIYILMALFLTVAVLVWRKAISKGLSQAKVVAYSVVVTLLLAWVVHALFNLAAGRELAGAIQQAKVLGIKLTVEELTPPLIAEEENAALVYQEAFDLIAELLKEHPEESKNIMRLCDWRRAGSGTLTSEQKMSVGSLVLENSDSVKLYQLAERAVGFPLCRFDIKYEDGPRMLLPHLSGMKQLAAVLAARTYVLTEEKKYKEAFESFAVGFRLGDSLADEPIFISQLVRIAVDQIAMRSLQQILNISCPDISHEHYREIISEIDKKEVRLTKALEGRFVRGSTYIFKRILQGTFKEVDFLFLPRYDGKDRFQRFYWRLYTSYLMRPIQKLDYAFWVRYGTQAIPLSRLPYYEASQDLAGLERKTKKALRRSLRHPLNVTILPMLRGVQEDQAKYHARLSGLKIALALEMHKITTGSYPDELAAIVPEILPELPRDPFTGKDYIYRKEGRGFVVYSVGENLKDDGGITFLEKGWLEGYDIGHRCEK